MILKVPNSIYLVVSIGGRYSDVAINNKRYSFDNHYFAINTIGEDIYIVGITKEDYDNGIYNPSVYKCNKNTIESGENISFISRIQINDVRNIEGKNGDIQEIAGHSYFAYINNTFLYLVNGCIYLSTDLNNWKEINLSDQISTLELPSGDQNIYI